MLNALFPHLWYMNKKLLSRLILVCTAIASVYTAASQGVANNNDADAEIKKLFSDKQEHESYLLKYSNSGSNYYWVAGDTLFSCGIIGGKKMAITDIDFTKSKISRDKEWLVKGTKEPVYKMELFPIKGKPVFNIGSFVTTVSGTFSTSYDKALTLDMADDHIANKALEYLKHLTGAGDGAPISSSGFDSQLSKLINGLKDDYAGMQGSRVDGDDVNCTVSLEGAVSTRIHTGMLRDIWLNADYGEFNTQIAAEAKYKQLIEKINNSKGKPCPMVQQNEMVSEPLRTQTWLPFDLNDVLDRSMKQFSIQLDLIKLFKFDKDFNQLDSWSVILRIKK